MAFDFNFFRDFSDGFIYQIDFLMSDELEILERIERLELLYEVQHLPADAIVGANYVAKLFDCSPEAVRRGHFGTDKIPRMRNSPVGFRKSDVHKVLKNMKKPVEQKAAEARAKAYRVKPRKSIITKQM